MEAAHTTSRYSFSHNICLAQIHFQLAVQYAQFIDMNGDHEQLRLQIYDNIGKVSFYASQYITDARINYITANGPKYMPGTLSEIAKYLSTTAPTTIQMATSNKNTWLTWFEGSESSNQIEETSDTSTEQTGKCYSLSAIITQGGPPISRVFALYTNILRYLGENIYINNPVATWVKEQALRHVKGKNTKYSLSSLSGRSKISKLTRASHRSTRQASVSPSPTLASHISETTPAESTAPCSVQWSEPAGPSETTAAETHSSESTHYMCCDCYICVHSRFLSQIHNPRHEFGECDHIICNTSDSVFADTEFFTPTPGSETSQPKNCLANPADRAFLLDPAADRQARKITTFCTD